MYKSRILAHTAFIVIFTGAILALFMKETLQVKLGLDLRSGSHITLQLLPTEDPSQPGTLVPISEEIRDRAIQVFTRRLNSSGTAEIVITPAGLDRLIVEIPEMTELDKATELVRRAGRLEFKERVFNPSTNTAEWKAVMDGQYVKRAQPAPDGGAGAPGGERTWMVEFVMTSEGARRFGDLTTRIQGQPLGIFFDGEEVSAPVVREPITGGTGVIQGGFTLEEVEELVNFLNAGALPVDVKILEAYTVSPTLGAESLETSKVASLLGLLVVLVYMLASYRLAGLAAGLALIVYSLWVALCMTLPGLEFVLTLPGIAGFVLSIGMAVDANVLQFERVREELRGGRSLRAALDVGFSKSFSSILDGHVTTFLGALILFWFGSSSVKGFGLTLMLGTGMSMLTAIYVTRQLLYFFTDVLKIDRPSLYEA